MVIKVACPVSLRLFMSLWLVILLTMSRRLAHHDLILGRSVVRPTSLATSKGAPIISC